MYHRLVIVTGASRGIGAEIAQEAHRRFGKNTLFLLVARNEALLNEVKSKISDPENTALVLKIDFSNDLKVDEYVKLITESLKAVDLTGLSELYVFYNHGTIRLGSLEEVADVSLHEFTTNVTSVWGFVAAIRKVLPIEKHPKQFHINISSLLASQTTANLSIYCSTRAARASLFRSLAIEQPELRVLNYQPGPVYTDMLKQIYEGKLQIYENYRRDYEEGKMLSPNQTITKLFNILLKNEFETGQTLDYFNQD